MRTSALVAAALAATTLLPSATAEAVSPAESGYAYGIAASGPLNLGPLPAVSEGHASLLGVPANPLLRAGVLNAAAGLTYSRASVADLRILRAALTASAVTAVCRAGTGRSSLVDAALAGTRLPVAAGPNTRVGPVGLPGVGSVELTLNKQVWQGGRLTVTAISLRALGQQVSIASATCRAMAAAPTPKPVKNNLPVTG